MSTVFTLKTLPDEILASILLYLDASSVVALHATCKRFVNVVNESTVWRNLSTSSFRYWNSKKQFRSFLASPQDHDWKEIYVKRAKNSRLVARTIQQLIDDPQGRSNTMQAIVKDGYQSKDALIDAFYDAHKSPSYLAQRFWSWVTLGCLNRTLALDEWTKIRLGDDVDDPTERALAALDMFILDERREGDIDDIFDTLNSYAASVRETYRDIDEQSPRIRAISIATHLRNKGWVGIGNSSQYYSLDHMFLGTALHSSHKRSIPLISAVIYCYVCRHFNLNAQPCNFPMHIHSVIQPTKESNTDINGTPVPSDQIWDDLPIEKTHLYMDVFNTDDPISPSSLQQRLSYIEPTLPQAVHLQGSLDPATAKDMLIRSANNILNSISRHAPTHTFPVRAEAAIYAARFALATFPSHPTTLRQHLTDVTQRLLASFDQDMHIFRAYIMPLTSSLPDHQRFRDLSTELIQTELQQPTPKIRAEADKSTRNEVIYRIGQVFRHRRRGYIAAIYGWDTTCDMPAHWINLNQVDTLPKGRDQPFYNVFVADDHSTRYVAQENIQLLGEIKNGGNGEIVHDDEIESFGIEIGKWFRYFDYDKGIFVSNVKHEYPDD